MRPAKKELEYVDEKSQINLPASIALVAILANSIRVAAQSSYSLRMENHTGYDIYQVHASSVWDADWEGGPPGEAGLAGRDVVYDYSDTARTLRCWVCRESNPQPSRSKL